MSDASSAPTPSAEPVASPSPAEGVGDPKPKSPVAALPKLTAKEAGRKAQQELESRDREEKGAAEPAKPEPEKKSTEALDRDTAKAKELVKAGDLHGAMKAIGVDPTKLGEAWTKQKRYFDNVATRVLEVQKQTEAKEQEVREIAEKLVKEHEGYAEARKLYSEGDYEAAFERAFGEPMHEFQKKAFAKMHNPGVANDPAVAALRAEVASLKKEKEEEARRALETENVRSIETKRSEYKKSLAGELAALDDAAIAAGAEDPDFVSEVFEEQRKHYDPRSDQTLSAQEAAEAVIERYRAAAERAKRFSGQPVASPAGNPNPLGKSAPSTTKPTSLSAKEASEAAAPQKLKGRELLEHYARIAAQKQA